MSKSTISALGYLNSLDDSTGKLTFAFVPGDDHTRNRFVTGVWRNVDILPYNSREFYVTSRYGITPDMRPLVGRLVHVEIVVRTYTFRGREGKFHRGIKLDLESFRPEVSVDNMDTMPTNTTPTNTTPTNTTPTVSSS